jgi:flagellar biosynthesis protein
MKLGALGRILKARLLNRTQVGATRPTSSIWSAKPGEPSYDQRPGLWSTDRHPQLPEDPRLAVDSIHLSPIGRYIGRLFADHSAVGIPPIITWFTPLMDEPWDANKVAENLMRSIAESGLFYESHLAQWLAGRRTIDHVQRESNTRVRHRMVPVALATPAIALGHPSAHAQTAHVEPSVLGTEISTWESSSAKRLIRDQLDVLAHQQIICQGPLAKGFAIDIHFRRDEPFDSSGAKVWHLNVRMRCPILGDIELCGTSRVKRLSLSVVASPTARPWLRDEDDRSYGALHAAGVSIVVSDTPVGQTELHPPVQGRSVALSNALTSSGNGPAYGRENKGEIPGALAIASAIIKRAHDAGVFVHDSPELVQLLVQVNLDEHIPADLYLAVATVLGWIHAVDRRASTLTVGQANRAAIQASRTLPNDHS